ncbi:MAG: pentapeptide repeat-containing protein [Anaerolineae bacterium]|nr:pentapeptide repeat-containing protein [Anaerolineae bacterium]
MPASLFATGSPLSRFRPRSRRQWILLVVGVSVFCCAISLIFIEVRRSDCLASLEAGGTDLGSCILTDADLSGRDLSGANLRRANLRGAILRDTNLSGADLSESHFPEVDLSAANLSGADLSNADFTDTTLTGVTLTGATLDGANFAGAVGLTDAMLLDALGIAPEQLMEALITRHIRLENRETILDSLCAVCQGMGQATAHSYDADSDAWHPLVLLGETGDDHAWTDSLPSEWEPIATRFAELVACTTETEEVTVETCRYVGGPPITRYQYRVTITLRAAQTGEILETETVSGSRPSGCPQTAPTSQTRIDGGPVSFELAQGWLGELVTGYPAP